MTLRYGIRAPQIVALAALALLGIRTASASCGDHLQTSKSAGPAAMPGSSGPVDAPTAPCWRCRGHQPFVPPVSNASTVSVSFGDLYEAGVVAAMARPRDGVGGGAEPFAGNFRRLPFLLDRPPRA